MLSRIALNGVSKRVAAKVVRRSPTRSGVDILDIAGLDLAAIAEASHTDKAFLDAVVARNQRPYAKAAILKRAGGTRDLDIPSEELMPTQRWILANILEKSHPHSASYAYSKGRSVRQCAEQHLGARWLLKMDLTDFFPSIDERGVYYLMLKEFGASKLLAFQIARLLTCTPRDQDPMSEEEPYQSEYRRRYVAGYQAQQLGRLPQGSPTSGAIANLVARGLDVRLTRLARGEGLTFTRYADDLFFSSYRRRDMQETAKLIGQVSDHVREEGFEVNRAKTRVARSGSPIKVLGLHVDGGSLRLPREIRDKIDGHLRVIGKFGLMEHAHHRGYGDLRYLLTEVDGLLGYANDVAKGWSRPRREEFTRLLAVNGIKRGPYSESQPESNRFMWDNRS